MHLIYKSASKKEYERLATDFYYESEKANGSVIKPVRKVALNRLSDGLITGNSAEILKRIDVNYANAIKALELTYDDFTSKIICLYNDNYYLIAHTTVVIGNNSESGEIEPFITDIIIKNGESLTDDIKASIRIRYGIYRKLLEYYEQLVLKTFPRVEKLDIHTYGNDGDFWKAMRDMGYDIADSAKLDDRMLLFSKMIRRKERDISDEGNITLK